MFKKFVSKFPHQDDPISPVNETRLDILLKQTQIMGFLSFVLAAILAFLMIDSPHGEGVVVWAGMLGLLFIIRWVFFYRVIFKLRKQGVHRFRLFHSVIVFFMLMAGLLWGTGAFLFMPYIDEVELFVTFITILVGITAGNMPSFAPSFIGYLCFMIPTLMGGALKAYSFGYHVLFVVVIMYMGYLALTALRMSKVVIQTISINIENERLLKQVTVEKNKAEKANIKKSQFLAAASHDLRQPLNSLGLFLYAFSQSLKDGQSNNLIFEKIQNSYQALKELFDALLEVSRLDAGNVECVIKPVALTLLLSSLVDEFKEQAKTQGLNIQYEGMNQSVLADRILLSRIVRNLLENAVKYTEKGQITVQESIHAKILTLSVMDTGIGIDSGEFENIFNEYHQLSNKRRDRRQGIGLGLAIVKKLANLMDYDVEVSSTVGKGSSFSLSLKLAESVASEPDPSQVLSLPTHVPAQHRVLVVDDDIDSLLGLAWLLESWGYQVDKASTYEKALQQVKQQLPDMILIDYRLQDNMNGIQVLLKLARYMPQPVPSIIISGDTDPDILEHIKGNGFMCLHKPVDAPLLQQSLNALMA